MSYLHTPPYHIGLRLISIHKQCLMFMLCVSRFFARKYFRAGHGYVRVCDYVRACICVCECKCIHTQL